MNPIYRTLIVQLTLCTIDEADRVQQFMRDRWRTLDGLSRQEFKREARAALKVARENPDLYAKAPA